MVKKGRKSPAKGIGRIRSSACQTASEQQDGSGAMIRIGLGGDEEKRSRSVRFDLKTEFMPV